jgi:hypothetical protein
LIGTVDSIKIGILLIHYQIGKDRKFNSFGQQKKKSHKLWRFTQHK